MLTLRTEGNVNKFIVENTISPLMASGEGHLQKKGENGYIRDSFKAVAIAL